MSSNNELYVPFRGTLRRSTWADENTTSMMGNIHISSNSNTSNNNHTVSRTLFTIPVPIRDERGSIQKLLFERDHYDRMQRLFQIVDSSGRGTLQRREMEEFVALRCPSFHRRDEAMMTMFKHEKQNQKQKRKDIVCSSTFDEMWYSVAEAGMGYKYSRIEAYACATSVDTEDDVSLSMSSRCSSECFVFDDRVEFGLEAWMVFCRLISMLQYQEAKSHFNRHQPREEEADASDRVIVIDVHPPTPPPPLNVETLLNYERRWFSMSTSLMSCSTNDILTAASKSRYSLPPPELDLNHCLIAVRDHSSCERSSTPRTRIQEFASNLRASVSCINGSRDLDNEKPLSTSLQHQNLDFAVTLSSAHSYLDRKTLDASAYLEVRRKLADFEWLHKEFSSHQRIGGTLCGRIIPVFPKLVENETNSFSGSIISLAKSMYSKAAIKIRSGSIGSEASVSIPNGDDDYPSLERSTAIEHYLNFLIAHPALSTSFPLNVILKVIIGIL